MDKKDIFEKAKSMMIQNPDSFFVLEEVVGMKTQLEYMKKTKLLQKSRQKAVQEAKDNGDFFFDTPLSNLISKLENTTSLNADAKDVLVELAASKDIAAFRALEAFKSNAATPIIDWAIMAYRESKIRLENELLDESQIYISTAMGGKGNSLRYFVAFESINHECFSPLQLDVIVRETKFHLEQVGGEFESIKTDDEFALVLLLIPFSEDPTNLISQIIYECNSLGSFINKKSIVSNVEELSAVKLRALKKKQNTKVESDNPEELSLPKGVEELMDEIKSLIAEKSSDNDSIDEIENILLNEEEDIEDSDLLDLDDNDIEK